VRTEEGAVRRKVIVTILFLSSMSAIAANLTPAEAAKHVGERTVCGPVASVRTTTRSNRSPHVCESG
jgi:hypothetical protein